MSANQSQTTIPTCQNVVPRVYKSVIDDVISNVREAFLDDGVDEHVLQELKSLWEGKICSAKALEVNVPAVEVVQPPPKQPQPIQRQQHAASKQPVVVQQPQPIYIQPAPPGGAPLRQYTAQQASMAVSSSQRSNIVGAARKSVIVHDPTGALSSSQIVHQQTEFGSIQSPPSVGTSRLIRTAQNSMAATAAIPTITLDQIRAGYVPGGGKNEAYAHIQQIDGQADSDFGQSSASSSVSQCFLNASRRSSKAKAPKKTLIIQLDGAAQNSDDDSDEFLEDEEEDVDVALPNDEEDDDLLLADDKDDQDLADDGEPLGPEDDISDEEDADEMFEAENVVVCQYEKVTRTKNKWKLVLKDGIMNLNGKDYVFQKATGEAEW